MCLAVFELLRMACATKNLYQKLTLDSHTNRVPVQGIHMDPHGPASLNRTYVYVLRCNHTLKPLMPTWLLLSLKLSFLKFLLSQLNTEIQTQQINSKLLKCFHNCQNIFYTLLSVAGFHFLPKLFSLYIMA